MLIFNEKENKVVQKNSIPDIRRSPLLPIEWLIIRVGSIAGEPVGRGKEPISLKQKCWYLYNFEGILKDENAQKAINFYNSLSPEEQNRLWMIYNEECVPVILECQKIKPIEGLIL